MPDVKQHWHNRWCSGDNKICCWPIWWKAEEQPIWVIKGEPKCELRDLILDTWRGEWLLKNTLTPGGAGSTCYKTASRLSSFFFFFFLTFNFFVRKCQFLTMETLQGCVASVMLRERPSCFLTQLLGSSQPTLAGCCGVTIHPWV